MATRVPRRAVTPRTGGATEPGSTILRSSSKGRKRLLHHLFEVRQNLRPEAMLYSPAFSPTWSLRAAGEPREATPYQADG